MLAQKIYLGNAGNKTLSSKTAVIKKLLGVTGLELNQRGRKTAELCALPRCPTAGWIVEFIGTQGIGKTTLSNSLHKTLRKNWFFRSDLGQTGPSPAVSKALENLHREIYFLKLKRLYEENADAWKILTAGRQMSRVISESLTILNNDFPRGFVLDESLFKNFHHEVLALAGDAPGPLWAQRAFIYLRTRDPEFVVARYQGRVAERAERGMLQVPPSDAELRNRIEQDNDLFDAITQKAQAFDCPVIVLYAEDDTQENIRTILEFEETVRSRA